VRALRQRPDRGREAHIFAVTSVRQSNHGDVRTDSGAVRFSPENRPASAKEQVVSDGKTLCQTRRDVQVRKFLSLGMQPSFHFPANREEAESEPLADEVTTNLRNEASAER
jgi:hypothetical protein